MQWDVEVSRGEEEQPWGEESRGAWAGGSGTLLGTISACLQLREPVSEPPISTVARGWMEGDGKGQDAETHLLGSTQTFAFLALPLRSLPSSVLHPGYFGPF